MPKSKSKSKPVTQEQYKILVPAIVAILVAVIGGFCGIFGSILVKYFEVEVIATPSLVTPSSVVPKNTPESFVPFAEVDPDALGMVQGPTPGIYISKGNINSRLQSFVAYSFSNTQIPAESKICLINKGYPPPERRPLNLSAHSITFRASIYSAANGKLTITGYQIFIEHDPINEKIRSLEILTGGAGGDGGVGPFSILELPTINISSPTQSMYTQEMNWLDLYEGEGVAFFIPIELNADGQYSIQAKFSFIFTSQDPNIGSKQSSLTTGQSVYSWLLIDDPRSYSISAGNYPVNLVDCP